jgi:predicted dinucleotide-binding enzyme
MTAGKYLVIGGTGGIGRMLANRLVMKYHKVSRSKMWAFTMRRRGRLMI